MVGEIAADAILLAATKYSDRQHPSREIKRAIAWTELQFQQKLNNALTVTPDELVTETAGITSELIDSYQKAIENVEQNLPEEDGEIYELLIRENSSLVNFKEKAVVDPQVDRRPPSPPRLEGEKNQSIQVWLSQWLSNKLQIPLSKIDRTLAFADYGIDSVMAVELAQVSAGVQRENPPQPPLQRGAGSKQEVETLSEDELARSLLAEIALAKGRDN